jgi:diacylglycerol kinase (ATP)
MRKILLFVNPRASQTTGAKERILEELKKESCQILHADLREGESFVSYFKRVKVDFDVLLVAGGDGTVQAAAEALRGRKELLSIIPLGTANNVARSLGIPINIPAATALAFSGKESPMDLAEVNGQLFVSVAGIGLSSVIHESIPKEKKRRWGAFSYALEALRLARSQQKSFRVRVRGGGESIITKALQVTICNGRFYGAHVQVDPNASLKDGLLDVSVIEATGYFKGALKALSPWHQELRSEGLKRLRAEEVEIHTWPEMKIDVEGSVNLHTPATFKVIKQALQVLAPA